jgi:hypothetical protein
MSKIEKEWILWAKELHFWHCALQSLGNLGMWLHIGLLKEYMKNEITTHLK